MPDARNDCDWRGVEAEILTAPNPFDPTLSVTGCPRCRDIGTLLWACDERGLLEGCLVRVSQPALATATPVASTTSTETRGSTYMHDPTGINRSLSIVSYASGEEASEAGYNYSQWGTPPTPLNVDKVVIVRNGMKSGSSTVDLVMVDEKGNKYVALITGNLLRMVSNHAG